MANRRPLRGAFIIPPPQGAVTDSYFGEHRTFSGLLMNKMRGDRGLNYGDYAYIESFIQDGGSRFPVPNIPRRQQFSASGSGPSHIRMPISLCVRRYESSTSS